MLDISGAAFLLLLLLPVMGFIGLFLLFYNRGKIFFTQVRPGKEEKLFVLLKFKTMKEPKKGSLLSETERITTFGKILRRSSLDELPQLLNILKGEMSFIGPRPLLPEYLPLYSDFQKKRHTVLPGITGWAQVKGRNSLDWEERFLLDVYYVENISLLLDLKITLLSFLSLFSGKGVYDKNGQIVENFKGNKTR
jgi:lipopolysaccharide/colanic/teichoic acid biosynthesis glycosyltransferase